MEDGEQLMKKTAFLVAMLVILPTFFAQLVRADTNIDNCTTIFYDGFEDGLGQWSIDGEILTSDFAFNGSYSLLNNITVQGNDYENYTVNTIGDVYFIDFKSYFNGTFSLGGTDKYLLADLEFGSNDWQDIVYLNAINYGIPQFEITVKDRLGNAENYTLVGNVPLNKWFDTLIIVNFTDKTVKYYFDETLYADLSFSFSDTDHDLKYISAGGFTNFDMKYYLDDFGVYTNCSLSEGKPLIRPIPNATFNITDSCCPISTFYCTDNETLVQMWNTSEGISWAVEDCPYLCDNVTSSCSPAPYEANIWTLVIIIIIIAAIAVLYRWSRR